VEEGGWCEKFPTPSRRETSRCWLSIELHGQEPLGAALEKFMGDADKPKERARAAWARLRKAEIDPRLPVAAWIAIEMIVRDDPQAVTTVEYKRVQAAKIIHRLVSGTHKRWEQQRRGRGVLVTELREFPTSRGSRAAAHRRGHRARRASLWSNITLETSRPSRHNARRTASSARGLGSAVALGSSLRDDRADHEASFFFWLCLRHQFTFVCGKRVWNHRSSFREVPVPQRFLALTEVWRRERDSNPR
jgi:hypothetical protein